MKILFTGANGQLGYQISKIFTDYELMGTDINEMDITDFNAVDRVVGEFKPDIIIHCAAYTAVDKAETDKEQAFLVNEQGTKNLVSAAKKYRARMVYVSTDYVFDGLREGSYVEEDKTNALGVYGKSKLAGEQAVKTLGENWLICRTAWLYGEKGKNFVETMLRLAKEKDELSVVNDQFGCPTYAKDLAKAIKFLVENNKSGIFHTVSSGSCSWYDFAKKIFELEKIEIVVKPVSTEEFPTPTKRPKYSVLSNEKLKLNGFEMRKWDEALQEYLENRKEEM